MYLYSGSIKSNYQGDRFFIGLFVFFLLVSSALKGDSVAEEGFWAELAWHPLVGALKNLSPVFFACFCLSGLLVLWRKRVILPLRGLPLVFVIIQIFALLRSMATGDPYWLKAAFTPVLFLFVYAVLASFAWVYGYIECSRLLYKSGLAFSFFFIGLNFLNILTGNGYVPGNGRLFGTSIHPNFLGVQLASCLIFVLWGIMKSPGRIKIFMTPVFLVGLVLLVLTGSRTAAVSFLVGAWLVMFVGGYRSAALFVVPLVFISAIGFVVSSSFDFYDRGDAGADTRMSAWASMLNSIIDNPILGVGYPVGKSENSYLRAMVIYGIPYGVFYFLLIVALLYKLFWRARKLVGGYDVVFCSLLAGLMMGAFFEGYLVDIFSLQVCILSLVLAMSGVRLNSQPHGLVVGVR